MTTLYRKEGRRYVVMGHAERYDHADVMKAGTWRVSYCYADGSLRYSYDVKPDTASFVAACELAGEAMERGRAQNMAPSLRRGDGARHSRRGYGAPVAT